MRGGGGPRSRPANDAMHAHARPCRDSMFSPDQERRRLGADGACAWESKAATAAGGGRAGPPLLCDCVCDEAPPSSPPPQHTRPFLSCDEGAVRATPLARPSDTLRPTRPGRHAPARPSAATHTPAPPSSDAGPTLLFLSAKKNGRRRLRPHNAGSAPLPTRRLHRVHRPRLPDRGLWRRPVRLRHR